MLLFCMNYYHQEVKHVKGVSPIFQMKFLFCMNDIIKEKWKVSEVKSVLNGG